MPYRVDGRVVLPASLNVPAQQSDNSAECSASCAWLTPAKVMHACPKARMIVFPPSGPSARVLAFDVAVRDGFQPAELTPLPIGFNIQDLSDAALGDAMETVLHTECTESFAQGGLWRAADGGGSRRLGRSQTHRGLLQRGIAMADGSHAQSSLKAHAFLRMAKRC